MVGEEMTPSAEELMAKMKEDITKEAINATMWLATPTNRLEEVSESILSRLDKLTGSGKREVQVNSPEYIEWITLRLALYKLEELLLSKMKAEQAKV